MQLVYCIMVDGIHFQLVQFLGSLLSINGIYSLRKIPDTTAFPRSHHYLGCANNLPSHQKAFEYGGFVAH